jgi:hypothetical protein
MANKIIDSLTYGSDNYTFTIPFGTCDTGADDPNKIVTCPNFLALEAGARIAVQFLEHNEAGMDGDRLTLTVNGFGPKEVSCSLLQDSTVIWENYSIVEFIYTGEVWRPALDSNILSALISGDLQPWLAENANSAQKANKLTSNRTFRLTGAVSGSASFNGSADCTIATIPDGLSNALILQASCYALGARVVNTFSAYPPVLVSQTSTITGVDARLANKLLVNHPGVRIEAEWYSANSAGGRAEYYIENNTPYAITIYFYIKADFSDSSGSYQSASSSRITKTLFPNEVASGYTDAVECGTGWNLESEYPYIKVEALGYDVGYVL